MPNAYPSQLTHLIVTPEELVDDMIVDRSVGGSARGRVLFTAPKRKFSLHHKCTLAVFNAYVRDFYLANRGLTVLLTWPRDGVVYTVMYEGPPTWTVEAPNLYDVKVPMVEQ